MWVESRKDGEPHKMPDTASVVWHVTLLVVVRIHSGAREIAQQ